MIIVDIHAHPLLDSYYTAPQARRPLLPGLYGSTFSFDGLSRDQVGVIVSSIYPFWTPARGSAYMERCRDNIQCIEAHLAERPGRFGVAATPGDIERILAEGKIALIHAVEGGHVLQGRAENLERLRAWGVRSLTLTHFLNNDLAASSFDPRRKLARRDGLTPLGREVVAGMNALGMIVDLAHCSERAFWQAMELACAPVIISHVGIRRYVPHELCLSDAQIRAVAGNGGVVGVILSSIWQKRYKLGGDVEDLVDNVLYLRDLVGAEHVGLGSDFNGTPPIRGIGGPRDLPRLSAHLQRRGLTPDEVAQIMGGSFLRLFAQVVTE